MGHGVSAAMLTGVVKSAFRASSPDGYEPRAVVHRLWSNMDAFGSERFVTMIAAVVSLEEGRVDYVNAGHPSGMIVGRTRGVSPLPSTGPLVSPAFRDCTWQQRAVAFERGDRLFLYTDGVSDAFAGPDDCGEESLVQLLRQHATDGDGHLLDSVLARVREQFGGLPQPDDLTLLAATIR
jgi:sigma-B regulation protein RsbU (phosphoserine phosphatase)